MAKQNELSGALFKNKKKEKDTHPTHTGSATIKGQKYWVSAWVNEPKSGGDKFMTLAFKPADVEAVSNQEDDFAF